MRIQITAWASALIVTLPSTGSEEARQRCPSQCRIILMVTSQQLGTETPVPKFLAITSPEMTTMELHELRTKPEKTVTRERMNEHSSIKVLDEN